MVDTSEWESKYSTRLMVSLGDMAWLGWMNSLWSGPCFGGEKLKGLRAASAKQGERLQFKGILGNRWSGRQMTHSSSQELLREISKLGDREIGYDFLRVQWRSQAAIQVESSHDFLLFLFFSPSPSFSLPLPIHWAPLCWTLRWLLSIPT